MSDVARITQATPSSWPALEWSCSAAAAPNVPNLGSVGIGGGSGHRRRNGTAGFFRCFANACPTAQPACIALRAVIKVIMINFPLPFV